MQFTVILPDTADDKVIQALSEAVHQAGGTVQPEEPAGAPEPGPEAGMPGEAMPGMAPPPPGGPLAAGPGAGMLPGQAMAAKGAFALRPRP